MTPMLTLTVAPPFLTQGSFGRLLRVIVRLSVSIHSSHTLTTISLSAFSVSTMQLAPKPNLSRRNVLIHHLLRQNKGVDGAWPGRFLGCFRHPQYLSFSRSAAIFWS